MMKTAKAQAITELAILGSIILLLLGVLLSYGLRANYAQQVTQSAFRRAMNTNWNINEPGQYILIHDKYIPNPSDAHGIGSVDSVSAAYAITRTYNLYKHADNNGDLANTVFAFGRGLLPPQEVHFKSARLRDFYWGYDPCNRDALKLLQIVYGQPSVWTDGMPENSARVVDKCDGDIISYEECHSQCRMFTDRPFCFRKCLDSTIAGTDCRRWCYRHNLTAPDYCPVLDQLFAGIRPGHDRVMGIQPDVVTVDNRNDLLVKQESPAGISSTDQSASSSVIIRRIVFRGGQQQVARETVMDSELEMGSEW
jgi:hypothetical protein